VYGFSLGTDARVVDGMVISTGGAMVVVQRFIVSIWIRYMWYVVCGCSQVVLIDVEVV